MLLKGYSRKHSSPRKGHMIREFGGNNNVCRVCNGKHLILILFKNVRRFYIKIPISGATEKIEDVTRQSMYPHTEIISCSFSLGRDVPSISQVTILYVWILEALYLATHALVFLEDIHHFLCIIGSKNFLSKYFCFILFKNFSPIYLSMEIFFLLILGSTVPDNSLHS